MIGHASLIGVRSSHAVVAGRHSLDCWIASFDDAHCFDRRSGVKANLAGIVRDRVSALLVFCYSLMFGSADSALAAVFR